MTASHSKRPDVVVVGAGAWGRAIAFRLSLDGASVRLVGDGRPATAEIAAGMLCPWSEKVDDGEDQLPSALHACARDWPALAARIEAASGASVGYHRTGSVFVASRPEHHGAVERLRSILARDGYEQPWIDHEEVSRLVPAIGPAVSGGIALEDEHSVDPRLLLQALDQALARAAVDRREASITSLDDPLLAAGAVVIAAGAGSGRLGLRGRVRPVKGQIVTLAPRGGRSLGIDRIVRTPGAYVVPRADGTVVVGATQEEQSDTDVTVDGVLGLLEEAVRLAPGLADARLATVAAGLRPATVDLRPLLGRDDAGVIWATGGFRHGVLLLPLVVDAISAEVAGRSPSPLTTPFSPSRFTVPV